MKEAEKGNDAGVVCVDSLERFNWKNYMECHVGEDYLLIWYDKEDNVIKLVRLGYHSELFGKGKKR